MATPGDRHPPVQGLWIGRPLSILEQLSLRSFLAFGYRFVLYSFEPIEGLPPGVDVADARSLFPEADVFAYQHGPGKGSYSAFSNVFRYKLLYERGGCWSDLDVVLQNPLPDLSGYLVEERDRKVGRKLASCFIKIDAGSEIMRRCLATAERADKQSVRWGEIGPKLLTKIADEVGGVERLPPDAFCPLDHWSFDDLLKPLPIPDCVAVHCWHEKFRRAGVDPGDAPPGSMFRRMLQRVFDRERERAQ